MMAFSKKNSVSNGDTLATSLTEFGFEGETVRALVDEGGLPWFNANDVCKALGYVNPRDAVADHVDEEDRNTVAIRDGIRGNPNKTFVNESGLYALIFGSSKPRAKRFKRWVTSEVLPSIRRTGGYGLGHANAYPAVAGEDEFALTPAFFARLYYALDRRLGAATLVWHLIDKGGLERWIEGSARQIAEDIGFAVRYSTINKFSFVLAEEGILDFRVGDISVPTRYRLIKSGLRKVLARVSMTEELRPGLSVMELVADQNRLLRSH
jgi:prophage antirepressor-like protein